MRPENFVYWLQGFFEISDSKELNERQVQIIKDHLALVFDKQTPNRNNIDANKVVEEFLKMGPEKKQELMFDPNTKKYCRPYPPTLTINPDGTDHNLTVCSSSMWDISKDKNVTLYC